MPILNSPGMRASQPNQRDIERTEQQPSREGLYAQHFKPHVDQPPRTGALFEQVNGYGVQLFSQATSFRQS